MEKLAKQANCDGVRDWIRSIANHLYWCASSTPDGDPDLMVAKWLSVDNHIHNVHEGHDSELFPRCDHEQIDETMRRKKWIKPSKYLL
jgi:solute carrier family 8 (sodium/calcium exchanger)